MTWPAEKRNFKQEGFRAYVNTLHWHQWRPSRIVLHNTAAPSLAQWIKTAEQDRLKGLIPGITRINNLERYFRDDNHWSGCPHLFIANDFIWVMNPLTQRGVHSPSFNSTAIGIEMIGDFSREDDDSGVGLNVKQNTVFALAALCSAIGLDPTPGETDKKKKRILDGTIFLHKQDWATTHDCPGKDVAEDKLDIIEEVRGLMDGGEHDPEATSVVISGAAPPPAVVGLGVTTVDNLNVRVGPGVLNNSLGQLPAGCSLQILGEARNAQTVWLNVRTPAGVVGWVSGLFVKET